MAKEANFFISNPVFLKIYSSSDYLHQNFLGYFLKMEIPHFPLPPTPGSHHS